jgi:hypothetical protein
MIMYNPTMSSIETRYDGKVYLFISGEKKSIYDPNEINHLIYKLEDQGLVSMAEGTKPEEEKPFVIAGLRKRRHFLDFRVRNFCTMNKERESAKLSAEPPSDLIIDTVNEIEAIDLKMKELLAKDFAKVDAYMKTQEGVDTTEKMDAQTQSVEMSGSKVSIKKGGPKVHVSSSGNP